MFNISLWSIITSRGEEEVRSPPPPWKRFNERCLKKRENAIPNLLDPSVEEQLQIGSLAPFHPIRAVRLMMSLERLLKEQIFTLLRFH